MKISAFTFLRNGAKLHYPLIESIRSALPLVDEFVVALGDSEPDDDTEDRIRALDSDKVVLFSTVWDLEQYPRGTEHAHQTDLAKERCRGDWLLYLQGDEVLHEDDLEVVRASCEHWLGDQRVEGMLFDYLHFWGDYEHVHDSHAWYKQEVRIVRNDPEIHSFRSAQSFRRIPDFDGVSYREKQGTQKLTVVNSGARIFHYGWVRPPAAMQRKSTHFDRNHARRPADAPDTTRAVGAFDYGPLAEIPRFEGTHPAVMAERIAAFDWGDQLYERAHPGKPPVRHSHDRLKYRFLTSIERALFGGRHMFASRNYRMLEGLPLPRKRNGPSR